MIKQIIRLVLCVVFINIAVYSQDTVAFPQKLEMNGFRQVITKTGNLYISGQPDADAFRKLKSDGVTTVINLRTEQEMSNRDYVPFDEKQLLDSLGIKYIHIPLGGADTPYNNEALNKFAEGFESADGKVLLHCTVAWRASHMWAAYLVQYKGFEPIKAIEHAKAINFGELPFEGLLGKKLKIIVE